MLSDVYLLSPDFRTPGGHLWTAGPTAYGLGLSGNKGFGLLTKVLDLGQLGHIHWAGYCDCGLELGLDHKKYPTILSVHTFKRVEEASFTLGGHHGNFAQSTL